MLVMKTILVPTDFSDTSINATRYAFGLAQQVGAKKIVLCNTFLAPISTTVDPAIPNVGVFDYDLMEAASLDGLASIREKLVAEFPNEVEVSLFAKYGYFADDINFICKETGADIIVIGITGGGSLTETIFGSNTTTVAKKAMVPVIIVPAKSCYRKIKKLLLVSDFEDVENVTPTREIKHILDATKAELVVLHIAPNSHHSLYEGAFECFTFKELFAGYNPQFSFVVNPNFAEAINTFSTENSADLTIIIPKKHSLLESIFTKSHTKELAFHSDIPLIAIHELHPSY